MRPSRPAGLALAILGTLLLAGCPSSQESALSPIACPAGLTRCQATCVDLASNAGNCGGCGQNCGLGTCAGGSCTCDAGTTVCTGLWPRCVNTLTDASNCGGCGAVCPLTNDVCVTSTCQCPPALPDQCPTASPTACVNHLTDPANCGACGNACATGATCSAGTCGCPSGEVVCGSGPGVCADRTSDPNNCGACGKACPAGATCTSSACQCGATPSIVCGAGGASPGTCCEGTGCCGSGCQVKHSNGLGGFFYDCYPLGTLSILAAGEAAAAWSATGTDSAMSCSGNCFARQAGGKCATWCYDGTFAGQVSLNANDLVCTCPPGGTTVATWN